LNVTGNGQVLREAAKVCNCVNGGCLSAKIIHVLHVIAGLDAAHGGPSYSVPKLCGSLAAGGADIELASVKGADGWEGTGRDAFRERRFYWDYSYLPVLRDLRWSTALGRALRTSAPHIDVIHNHGLWLMPNVQAGWVAREAKKPLVVSPRGMLAPAALAFSRRKKQVFWRLLQGSAIRDAACFHATSEQEYEEIRAFGLVVPVAIIPNGVDIPEFAARSEAASITDRVVLSLGRLHPKKGLDTLVRAWAQIERDHPGWRLRIVGPDEAGYAHELAGLISSLGIRRAAIEGPVYGDAKWQTYRAADLFVLPSLNENFGLTVAEALATGIPVIATKGTPWSGLTAEGCGWWVDHGVDALASALDRAMAMPRTASDAMGMKGRAWMTRDFSWDRVGREMLDMYRWVKENRETRIPHSVRPR
jgi:glycosyltransferase involved in cell wall biosynthesis